MSQKNKLLKAIKNNPRDVALEDIKKLLEGCDYICHNSGGSHFVFRKEGFEHIVIPYNRPIKAVYVKHILAILEGDLK